MNRPSAVATGVVALLPMSKKATFADMSWAAIELFCASAKLNRKRLGPTASWTSMRIGIRVVRAAADGEAPEDPVGDVVTDGPHAATSMATSRATRTSDPLPEAGRDDRRDDAPSRRHRGRRPVDELGRRLSHVAGVLPGPVPAGPRREPERLVRMGPPDGGRDHRRPRARPRGA